MGGNSPKEWKNQGKQHFFLWITHKMTSSPCKKNTSTLNTIWEKSEENKVQRKKWKQKNKKEKKRKGEKKRRRDFGAFLSRVYVCAHSNRNVVFLLSQVSHRGRKIGVNSIEKWENSGKSKKNNEEKCVFLCGSESFLDDYLIRLLNFPQRQPITT